MKILDLKQNSDEWLEARLNHFCASEAPAMMGASKFMSRNQLLDIKAGWKRNPDSSFKAMLFQKGHEYEAEARKITELEYCDDFPPVVGECHYSEFCLGDQLLASFDGLSDDFIWEHKAWNAVLAENVRNGLLEPHYYWQLEHQCLVAGIDRVVFTCSDGTAKNRVSMVYTSQPERRKALIAGWRQFAEDLKNHELEAKIERVASDCNSLPSIICSVNGLVINSNINQVLAQIKILADAEMSRKLECDQDFADKDAMNKAVKKARDELKRAVADVKSNFDAQAKFEAVASDLDAVLQKMQAHGEKLVTQEKERKKLQIINEAKACLNDFIELQAGKFDLINLYSVIDVCPDFAGAVKGKRTLDSIKNAVDAKLASVKIDVMGVVDLCAKDCDTFKQLAKGYEFLFNDLNQIVGSESFDLIVKSRISDHQRAEEKRIEAERIRIEQEAKIKAEREAAKLIEIERERARKEEAAKAMAEAEAKAKAQREAEAAINAEREKIRAEELAKAKAEADAEQSTLMIATKQHEQVDAVNAGVNEYLVRAEWFGYSRGYSVYKVTAESEDAALDNYKLGSIIESVTTRSDVEDNDVAILKGKNNEIIK